jgi:hypothetical protein
MRHRFPVRFAARKSERSRGRNRLPAGRFIPHREEESSGAVFFRHLPVTQMNDYRFITDRRAS